MIFFFNVNNLLVFKEDTSQSVNIMSLTHAFYTINRIHVFFLSLKKKRLRYNNANFVYTQYIYRVRVICSRNVYQRIGYCVRQYFGI